MIAIELETLIHNHRLELTNPSLPSIATKARIIVLYEEPPATETERAAIIQAVVARTHGILGNKSMDEIDAEIKAMRDEWDEGLL